MPSYDFLHGRNVTHKYISDTGGSADTS
jgi:hypothetical protein